MGETEKNASTREVVEYWDRNIHDHKVVKAQPGSAEYFSSLAEYRYQKSKYLLDLISGFDLENKTILEVGTGTGIDLLNIPGPWSMFQAIDLSFESLQIAKEGVQRQNIPVEIVVMDGERTAYKDGVFDLIYVHSVLPYTSNDKKMIDEVFRLLKIGGKAILVGFHKNSWLYVLSRYLRMDLDNQKAPEFRVRTKNEFMQLFSQFKTCEISTERFPVETRLYSGVKAVFFNRLFVPLFNRLPEEWVRDYGWHLIARVTK